MIQPVIIRSFMDEFGIQLVKNIKIPVVSGEMLMKIDVDNEMDAVGQKWYRSGVGMLLYLAKWSRPDI